ncbi:hypothetical protein C8R46DRAFT_1197515 [Mycena filopes]|nr:hypothetical protein C8R46DRAFT_1197515 [Mycena filopes]
MVAHSNRAAPLTRKLTISPNSDSTRSKAPAPASPTFPLPPAACAWLDLEWWWLGPFGLLGLFLDAAARPATIPPAPPLPGHSALTRPFLTPARFIESGSTAQTDFDFNSQKLEIITVGSWVSKLEDQGFRLLARLTPGLQMAILSRLLLGFRPALEDEMRVVDPRPKVL